MTITIPFHCITVHTSYVHITSYHAYRWHAELGRMLVLCIPAFTTVTAWSCAGEHSRCAWSGILRVWWKVPGKADSNRRIIAVGLGCVATRLVSIAWAAGLVCWLWESAWIHVGLGDSKMENAWKCIWEVFASPSSMFAAVINTVRVVSWGHSFAPCSSVWIARHSCGFDRGKCPGGLGNQRGFDPPHDGSTDGTKPGTQEHEEWGWVDNDTVWTRRYVWLF